MESMKSLYKAGTILLLGFIFLKAGGFLFKVICMNMLPVDAYGEVAVFLVLYNWFVLFATFNVTIGVAKFVSHDKKNRVLYYTSSLVGSLSVAIIISFVLLFFSQTISEVLNLSQTIIYWAILSVPFAVIYNTGIFYLRGMYRMGSSVKADLLMTSARLIMLVGLLWAGLYYAPYAAFLVSFILIDVYLLLRNRVVLTFGLKKIMSTFRILLLYSMPIFLSEFLRLFSVGVDRLMLSGFYSTVEAGFYDVAVSLCIGYVIIANSYSNALLPLASVNQKHKERKRRELFRALKASSLFFILYTAIIVLGGQYIIYIINPVYMGIFAFLPMLAVSYIFIGFLTILCFFANSTGYQRHAVYSGAVFAFLSLALNFYLIPKMFYMGAVNALIISSLASVILLGALTWKRQK